jgi:hypothetical protein
MCTKYALLENNVPFKIPQSQMLEKRLNNVAKMNHSFHCLHTLLNKIRRQSNLQIHFERNRLISHTVRTVREMCFFLLKK